MSAKSPLATMVSVVTRPQLAIRPVTVHLDRRITSIYRLIGEDIRRQREDAGVSQRRLASAAGVDQSYLAKVEAATVRASVETLTAISLALGADLSVRLFPNTGPPIRDKTQAVMLEALLRVAHRRWRRFIEVQVVRPVRGVIDLVLHEPGDSTVVALEAQSQMRRLEQQVRWGHAKADALTSSSLARRLWPKDLPTEVSAALLLRSTRANRDLAVEFEELLRAAYPAPTADALASLTCPDRRWPGSAILWADVTDGTARILEHPPRGVRLGR